VLNAGVCHLNVDPPQSVPYPMFSESSTKLISWFVIYVTAACEYFSDVLDLGGSVCDILLLVLLDCSHLT
jgi:hypothetical protein